MLVHYRTVEPWNCPLGPIRCVTATWCGSVPNRCSVTEFPNFPVNGNLAEPGDSRISERDARVQAASDGAGDERPALLGQQTEHSLLCRHKRIQPRGFAIKVVCNGALLAERGDQHISRVDRFTVEPRNCCFVRSFIKPQSLKEPVEPAQMVTASRLVNEKGRVGSEAWFCRPVDLAIRAFSSNDDCWRCGVGP